MSRTKARKMFSIEDHVRATEGVECRKDAGVIDETPMAYKDIDDVMAAQSDLLDVVHRLKQVLCVKGWYSGSETDENCLVQGEFENCQLCGHAQRTVKIISQGTCGYLVYLQFTWSHRYQISCYLFLYGGPDSYATILQTPIYTDCSTGLKRPKDKLTSTSIRVQRPATLDPLDTSYTVVSLVSVWIKYQCTLIQMKSYPFRATQPGWR